MSYYWFNVSLEIKVDVVWIKGQIKARTAESKLNSAYELFWIVVWNYILAKPYSAVVGSLPGFEPGFLSFLEKSCASLHHRDIPIPGTFN